MSKQFRSIILHAGLPKTATTSIQHYCYHNAQHLQAHGVFYPRSWPINHSDSLPHIAQSTHHIERLRQRVDADYLQKDWQKLLNSEITQVNVDNLLLSSELIHGYTEAALRNLKHFASSYSDNIRIIIYLRHHVSLCESLVPQILRTSTKTLQDIENQVCNRMNNYMKTIMQRLSLVFGEKSITVFSYESASTHAHSVVGHFLQHMHVPYLENSTHLINKNPRLSHISCDILDIYNRATKPDTVANKHVLMQIKGNPYTLSHSRRQQIMSISADDRAWVYQTYGIDYRELPNSTHNDVSSPKDIDETVLLDIFSKLSPSLQDATLQYFRMNNFFDIDQLAFLQQSSIAKQQFINHVNNHRIIKSDNMYLACAIALASHRHYAIAIKFLNYALTYNPESAYIRNMIREYTQQLSSTH